MSTWESLAILLCLILSLALFACMPESHSVWHQLTILTLSPPPPLPCQTRCELMHATEAVTSVVYSLVGCLWLQCSCMPSRAYVTLLPAAWQAFTAECVFVQRFYTAACTSTQVQVHILHTVPQTHTQPVFLSAECVWSENTGCSLVEHIVAPNQPPPSPLIS